MCLKNIDIMINNRAINKWVKDSLVTVIRNYSAAMTMLRQELEQSVSGFVPPHELTEAVKNYDQMQKKVKSDTIASFQLLPGWRSSDLQSIAESCDLDQRDLETVMHMRETFGDTL